MPTGKLWEIWNKGGMLIIWRHCGHNMQSSRQAQLYLYKGLAIEVNLCTHTSTHTHTVPPHFYSGSFRVPQMCHQTLVSIWTWGKKRNTWQKGTWSEGSLDFCHSLQCCLKNEKWRARRGQVKQRLQFFSGLIVDLLPFLFFSFVSEIEAASKLPRGSSILELNCMGDPNRHRTV